MIMINGEMRDTVLATDRALHYGDGLFETIAVIDGQPRLWSKHMVRLQQGCERLGLPLPDSEQLYAEAHTLCADQARAVLKIIYSRGSGGRGYRAPEKVTSQRLLFRYPWPDTVDTRQGIRLRLCDTPLACNPALAGIKHLNRLEQVLARAEWDDTAIYEGLMCDLDGRVKEGTMSNLFWVKDAQLYTPDMGRCGVAGVMRSQVMTLAAEMGLCIETAESSPEELKQMDELFITNALIGILPVAHFDGVDFTSHTLTHRLQAVLTKKLDSLL